jgi:hypothetical protein
MLVKRKGDSALHPNISYNWYGAFTILGVQESDNATDFFKAISAVMAGDSSTSYQVFLFDSFLFRFFRAYDWAQSNMVACASMSMCVVRLPYSSSIR